MSTASVTSPSPAPVAGAASSPESSQLGPRTVEEVIRAQAMGGLKAAMGHARGVVDSVDREAQAMLRKVEPAKVGYMLQSDVERSHAKLIAYLSQYHMLMGTISKLIGDTPWILSQGNELNILLKHALLLKLQADITAMGKKLPDLNRRIDDRVTRAAEVGAHGSPEASRFCGAGEDTIVAPIEAARAKAAQIKASADQIDAKLKALDAAFERTEDEDAKMALLQDPSPDKRAELAHLEVKARLFASALEKFVQAYETAAAGTDTYKKRVAAQNLTEAMKPFPIQALEGSLAQALAAPESAAASS